MKLFRAMELFRVMSVLIFSTTILYFSGIIKADSPEITGSYEIDTEYITGTIEIVRKDNKLILSLNTASGMNGDLCEGNFEIKHLASEDPNLYWSTLSKTDAKNAQTDQISTIIIIKQKSNADSETINISLTGDRINSGIDCGIRGNYEDTYTKTKPTNNTQY